ncbi:MAG: hypothetical protein ACT4OK_10895 [Gemmobacter sp.]
MSSASEIIFPTIAATVESFFKPERRRQQALLAEMIQRNRQLGGHEYGFYHNGRLFSLSPPSKLRGHKLERAYPEIGLMAEDLVEKQAKLKEDTLRMNQGLAVIVARCESFQAYRDSIPEPLVQHTPFSHLARMGEEARVLQGNHVLAQQYAKLERIVLYYSANALIY